MKEKVKISIITPSLNGGGAEKVAVNLANHYASSGYCVDLVVFSLVGPYQALIGENVNLVNLGVARSRYVFFEIRRYLRSNSSALILSVIRDANIFVGIAAYGLSIQSLVFREANTMDAIEAQWTPKKVSYKLLMKCAYRLANCILANSNDTKLDLLKNKIIPENKVKVIRNPVLPPGYQQLKTKSLDEAWFFERDSKVVLSVGRLHRQKNFPFLLSVFEEVYKTNNSARLMIVGDGEEKDHLLDLIDKKGLSNVAKIVGFQYNIYPYYENAAVFALTSDWEGFGNVLVEALSVGLPVISTNCPGGPKMILKKGKYGALIPLGDREAFVRALLKALENPSRSLDAINYSRRYSVECVAQDYLTALAGP